MLTRATRRSLRNSPILLSIGRCPYRISKPFIASSRWIRTTPTAPESHLLDSPRTGHRTVAKTSPTRSISTTTDGFSFSSNEHVPFLNPSPTIPVAPPSPLATFLPLWDYTRGTELARRDAVLGLNMDESLKNLRACLTVGRYDRAEAIFRRLANAPLFNVAEIQEANNTYIRSLVHALFRSQDGVTLKKLQSWFEVDMRQIGIAPDATTLALMCRSAFLLVSEKSKDRTIRRYLYIAEEMGLLEDTLASGEYLPYEWNELCQIRKDLFENIPEEMELQNETSPSSSPSSNEPLVGVPENKSTIELKSSTQRGLGLDALLKGLRSLHNESTTGQLDDAARNRWQVSLEEDIVTAELERWRAEHAEMLKMGINPALSSKSMAALLWEWQEKLKASIEEHLEKIQKQTSKYIKGDGPYLEQIGAQKLAAITILETLRSLSCEGIADGANVYKVTENIGCSLEMESAVVGLQQLKETKQRRVKQGRRRRVLLQLRKEVQQAEAEHEGIESSQATRERRAAEWPKSAKLRSAALLLSKLIDIAKFPTELMVLQDGKKQIQIEAQSAFSHVIERRLGRRRGMIYANAELTKRLTREPPPSNMAHQLPMVAKPEPWADFKGGYLRYPATLMRLNDPSGIGDMYIHAAIQDTNLEKVFAGLNVLGKTEWRINRLVFEVMANVWNSGEPLTNFPPANPELVLPQEPAEDADKPTKYKWRKEVQRLQNEHNGFHSNRCFLNLQMEIARAFLGHSFFLPHNMDFRGRAYPIGGIFHHMGADNARGLFQFAKGKQLGENGIYWLKIHLANTFGFDKASLDERAQFAMDHLDDIRDSITNPMAGRRWWMEAEDPWQCLACCFELLGALDSPDPTKFVSHLPVHQDGTCNGLQHYAALGGDELGAAQVNLIPRERPADIYSEVARLVKEDIEKDAAEGNPMAILLKDKITRKVVKQPVMTYVYGVTYYGAKLQVQKRLDEIIPDLPTNEFRNRTLASYITKKVFTHFGTLFSGATQIQHWLAGCAGRVSTAVTPDQIEKIRQLNKEDEVVKPSKKDRTLKFQSGVVWTTPLNLPVVQPYRQLDRTRSLPTAIQNFTIFYPSVNDTVHKRKQMAGFPPNFIHSLDATHMLMSALKCDELGLTFASVHDSFWTHAADVPVLSKALRDAFVQIHSEDVIGRLAEEFRTRYKHFMQSHHVPGRSPLGRRITKLRAERRKKLEKKTMKEGTRVKDKLALDELIEEYDRLQLLRSEDPEERARGEAMVTPGSLFAAVEPGHPDLLHPDDLELAAEAEVHHPKHLITELNLDEAPEEEIDVELPDQQAASKDASREVNVNEGELEKKRKRTHAKNHFWVPLDFPSVPKKGHFDVNTVKSSPYFFS